MGHNVYAFVNRPPIPLPSPLLSLPRCHHTRLIPNRYESRRVMTKLYAASKKPAPVLDETIEKLLELAEKGEQERNKRKDAAAAEAAAAGQAAAAAVGETDDDDLSSAAEIDSSSSTSSSDADSDEEDEEDEEMEEEEV